MHHGTGEIDRQLVWKPEYDIGVPDINEHHHQEHLRYQAELQRFSTDLASGRHDPLLLAFRTNFFLFDWFVNYTTGTDRHLGRFLRDAAPAMADHHKRT